MPRCYHCDINSDGTDFVLVLADMAPAVPGRPDRQLRRAGG